MSKLLKTIGEWSLPPTLAILVFGVLFMYAPLLQLAEDQARDEWAEYESATQQDVDATVKQLEALAQVRQYTPAP